jgi:hypothetical protein
MSILPTPKAPPTPSVTPSEPTIANLRATLEGAALLPDEDLQGFLTKFRKSLVHESLPWVGDVIGTEILEIGRTKFWVGWRWGLVWGVPIGSLVALAAVATGVHWAAA